MFLSLFVFLEAMRWSWYSASDLKCREAREKAPCSRKCPEPNAIPCPQVDLPAIKDHILVSLSHTSGNTFSVGYPLLLVDFPLLIPKPTVFPGELFLVSFS